MVPGIVDPLRSQTNISNLPTVTQEGSAVVEDRPCAAEELALVEGPPALIENRPLVKNHPAVESPPAAIEDLPVIAISDDLPALVLEHAPFVLKDLSAILPGGLATSHLSDSSTFSSMSDCSTTMRFTPSRIPRLASLSSLRRATILDARTQSTVPDPSTASATCNRSISSVEPTVFTASTLSTPPSVTRHTISSYAHMKFVPATIPPTTSPLYNHMHIYSIPRCHSPHRRHLQNPALGGYLLCAVRALRLFESHGGSTMVAPGRRSARTRDTKQYHRKFEIPDEQAGNATLRGGLSPSLHGIDSPYGSRDHGCTLSTHCH